MGSFKPMPTKPPVATVCVGLAASMGSLILSQGAKGKRYVLPNAEVMIHQPLTGVEGQASDIEITAREIQKLKKELSKIQKVEEKLNRAQSELSELKNEYGKLVLP